MTEKLPDDSKIINSFSFIWSFVKNTWWNATQPEVEEYRNRLVLLIFLFPGHCLPSIQLLGTNSVYTLNDHISQRKRKIFKSACWEGHIPVSMRVSIIGTCYLRAIHPSSHKMTVAKPYQQHRFFLFFNISCGLGTCFFFEISTWTLILPRGILGFPCRSSCVAAKEWSLESEMGKCPPLLVYRKHLQ